MAEQLAHREILDRIAALADELDGDQRVGELLDWIDAFHREGLGRVIEMARQWRGEIFIEALVADDVAGEFLGAYGLGVNDDGIAAATVQAALAEVRPYLHSHGGDLEVIEVLDGVVTLRRHGSCDGCTAVAATLAERVDDALRRHWNDFRRVELVPSDAQSHPPPPSGQVTTGLQIARRSATDAG